MSKKITSLFVLIMGIVLTSCKEETLPKPSAHLRLDYPEASYADFESECPFIFDFNINTKVKSSDCDITIHYPKMKATLYLSYKAVEDDLNTLLRDAQKLTYEHVVKADDIIERPFINSDDKVYGMFYQVGGNAATNTQFYVTDSLQHFITGSVYFYAKPNFDSIMPATSYIKNDVQNLMETLRWK